MMYKSSFVKTIKSSLCLLAALLTPHFAQALIIGPYGVDSNTLHLWHLDELTTP